MAQPSTPTDSSIPAARKPRDDELDVFGLTHPGKVRPSNQDHFLFCTLHKALRVRVTSLPNPELLEIPSERLASLFMVADGVGSSEGGEAASRVTVETTAAYVTHTMQCYYQSDMAEPAVFLEALEDAARTCHETVLERAKERPDVRRMATTLTLCLAVWPRLFILHIGDSRCYRFRGGELTCLTRDQTMAQALVDSGVLKPEDVPRSPFRNVLASAIGGTTQPVVGQHGLRHGDLLLLCTDGLTKHVSDERILERLRAMESSEQVTRALVEDALEAGGTDNVTVLVARNVIRT
jgi:serine/threonine protein phosphatase PrpC